jgi:hypothetical protein
MNNITLWWLSNADVAELQAQPTPEQVAEIEQEQDEEPEPEEYRRYA